ncbi:hypothetical protein JCM3766R1_003105 [Sporobolomyces carnicolor]
MAKELERSNTTTTFSSFFGPSRKPSSTSRQPGRPEPPPNYRHVDDDVEDDPRASALDPESARRSNLRASKLGLVERLTTRERIDRWNELQTGRGEGREEGEPGQTTPLEKWRLHVANEVAKERRREQSEARQRQRFAQEQQEGGDRVTSWKPSVVTTSSMRSAAVELERQLDSSSPFARSFGFDELKTPRTAESAPTSSVVRESFLNDARGPEDGHPYSHTFTFDDKTASLVPVPPRLAAVQPDSSLEETLALPIAPETCASASPVDPAFATEPYRFPLAQQRHALAKIDTSTTPATSKFSTSPVSAPVVTTYPSFVRPPRTSSLPFQDLDSIEFFIPSSRATSVVPPAVPPKDDDPRGPSFALLPPKAAALLGLIPTSHPSLATPRPPKPPFAARDRQGSLSSSGATSTTEPYRSSFHTNYDGPRDSRPSVESSTPTSMMTSPPSTCHGAHNHRSATLLKNRSNRPPPLRLAASGSERSSSLPDLHDPTTGSVVARSPATSWQGRRGPRGSSVSSSLDLERVRGRPSSFETPRTIVFDSYPSLLPSRPSTTRPDQIVHENGSDNDVESLLDAPLHDDDDERVDRSPPFPLPPKLSRFGRSIGQDLSSPSSSSLSQAQAQQYATRNRARRGGRGGIHLARSISQKSKGLARKLSLKNLAGGGGGVGGAGAGAGAGGAISGVAFTRSGLENRGAEPSSRLETRIEPDRGDDDLTTTTTKQGHGSDAPKKQSLKDLKRGFDRKLEQSFRYW